VPSRFNLVEQKSVTEDEWKEERRCAALICLRREGNRAMSQFSSDFHTWASLTRFRRAQGSSTVSAYAFGHVRLLADFFVQEPDGNPLIGISDVRLEEGGPADIGPNNIGF